MSLLTTVVAFGAAIQYLVYGQQVGLNAPVCVALLLALAFLRRPRAARFRWRELWLPLGAITLALAGAIRTDASLIQLNALALLALASGSVAAFGGVIVSSLGLAQLGEEVVVASWSLAAGAGTLLRASWPRRVVIPDQRLARLRPYLRGALLSLPLVVVFAALFSAADAVFAKAVGDLVDLRRLYDLLRDLPARAVLAALAAWVALAAIANATRPRRSDAASRWPLMGIEPAVTMLAIVDVLFAAFVAFQIAYLFGGRDTLDAAAITYSAYARRGFFELIAVALIVAGLVFSLETVIRARGRLYVGLVLALLVETSVVLASAAYRLDLYQRAYGWSEQRLYANAVIAWLAAALALFAWSIARGRTGVILPRLAMAAFAVLVGLNILAPSAFIARTNLDRFLDPAGLPDDAERSLDSAYLMSLGDGAIPVIVDRLPRLPARERGPLERLLARERFKRDLFHDPDWRSWNLDRELARRDLVFR